MTRYVQKGEAVDYRPTEAVAAGDGNALLRGKRVAIRQDQVHIPGDGNAVGNDNIAIDYIPGSVGKRTSPFFSGGCDHCGAITACRVPVLIQILYLLSRQGGGGEQGQRHGQRQQQG